MTAFLDDLAQKLNSGEEYDPTNLLNWNSSRQDLKEVASPKKKDLATNPRRIFVSTKSVL